ncbi:MAG: hypothetical protein HY293_09635, partial [Planctomycetes bacterium]|nr:hypothetical protein [Planctomycetota bacterium]
EPRSEPLVPRVDPVAVLQVELKAPEPVAPAAKPEPAPPPAAPKRAPPPEPVAAPVDDKPLSLTFARLAFRYWPQPKDKAAARDPFPKEIRALAGRKVTIDGFMFPIDFEKGKVRSFLLSNGMFGCCFGDAPQLQETIKVFRTDGKLMPYQATARVTGVLEVGEEFDGDGYVDSVFRIRAEAVVEAPSNH